MALNRRWRIPFTTLLLATLAAGWSQGGGDTLAAEIQPSWSGQGRWRLLVEVPTTAATRPEDEMLAAFELDLDRLLGDSSLSGSTDIGSFQVHAYDASTGRPKNSSTRYGRSPYDLPCRFEDTEVPDQYASRVGRASETSDGRAPTVVRDRKSRLFNREMNNHRGRLVWSHRNDSVESSHYAIYFDPLPPGAPPATAAAPWLGDADVLRAESGQPLGGFSHFTAGVGDLNGDGLFDLVAGTEKGDLLWIANRGTAAAPKFLGAQLLQDELGPIDAGWYGAPFLHDWDGDGDLDLIVGASGNVILWWKNAGDVNKPKFQYGGFVKSDGKRLEVPEQPVAEDVNDIFARDYFNQPWVGDLDDDGYPDLVTGGYTTGRIFWYRGLARGPDGTPELTYAGMLQADGEPIDTIWAAAPLCIDFNGDGRLDLVTGGWRWSGVPGPVKPGEDDLLHFYEGVESADELPAFSKISAPINTKFPSGSIARPSAVDANGDGLLDLVVSESGGHIYIFFNVGTPAAPVWDVTSQPLTVPWGFVRDVDVAAATADLEGDGTYEYLVGNVISTLQGSPAAPQRKQLGVAHVAGKPIEHAGPGYGDPYYYSLLCHWDEDGRADILWGMQQGNIYLHRNLAQPDALAFGEGELLRLTTGEPLHLGPPPVDSVEEATDFTILQGSRIVLAYEDFDGDGVGDVIAGETYGNLWVFRGVASRDSATFEPGVIVNKLVTRPEAIACLDSSGDGRPDLLIGGTADDPVNVYANTSQPGKPSAAAAESIRGLPYLFWGPKVRACDWNRDGDVDLMVQSEFFSFWIERSFLDHGYRQAQIVSKLQTAPEPREAKVGAPQ